MGLADQPLQPMSGGQVMHKPLSKFTPLTKM